MPPTFQIFWTEKAKQALEAYYEYIKLDSPTNALRVRREIIQTTRNLSEYPERYQKDEFYPNNNGEIRRFFKWNYRVVYEIIGDEKIVVILDVQHTSQGK